MKKCCATCAENKGVGIVEARHMTMTDRAASYLAASQKYRPLDVIETSDGIRVEGLWVLGNNYRGSGYYGAFPPGFMTRIRALFPDCPSILHLFSGSLPPEPGVIRIDSNPDNKPDVVGDAHRLRDLVGSEARVIVADPPYTDEDCDHYGVTRVRRREVIEQCHQTLAPGGFLVWLDQVWPMYRKTDWSLRGLIGVVRSTNHRTRVVTILEKR